MKKIVPVIMALTAALSSCKHNDSDILVLYYSQNGATEKVAKEIQKQTGADIERFDVEEEYDGDFDETIARVKDEASRGFMPTLKPLKSDLSKYKVIFLGYPVWFGTCPPAVQALTSSVDFSDKKIVPFCTFGSGGLLSSTNALVQALPVSEVVEGYGVRNARIKYAPEEINRFLIENGYKQGHVDPLPDYSQPNVLNPEQEAIYQQATNDYPYPLGDPITVCGRNVPGGVDYIFNVMTTNPDGDIISGKVYVQTRKGRDPEFTQVDR